MATSSLFLRRLRALLRSLTPGGAGGPIEGFVDGCIAGEIRGWAMDRRQPNRRVHVLALSDGRVVAEALADLSRSDLVQDGRGDGRHAFRLRLPAALLDGGARTVQVQAMAGGTAVRLLRGEIEIGPPPEAEAASRLRTGSPPALAAEDDPAPAPLLLALWPGDGEMSLTLTDWNSLQAPASKMIQLGAGELDATALGAAHTVILARRGDRIDPAAADLLVRSRPLADILTWDGDDDASRRPEARALGLLLGETLGGRFAIRGHVLALAGAPLLDALAAGDLRQAELILAERRELRWAHLPGRLVAGAPGPASPSTPAPARRSPERLSLAIWPEWSAEAARSLQALLAQAPSGARLEALVEASGADPARELIRSLGLKAEVRPVDAPAAGTPGAWLAALTAAASGEAVIVCQAGVRLGGRPGALEEIAAWACSPMVGAVTIEIRGSGGPLAGVGISRDDIGWSARSAFSPELQGRSRPVLAAPAAFMAVARDKLAKLGGPADDRLPAGGADLDLGLRLRRIGLSSLLLGHLEAEADMTPSGEIRGAALAAFDAAELAAAAAAYPAPPGR